MALAPSGELTSIGIGKETTYGTAVTPTVFLISSGTLFSPVNDFLERPGARQRIGRTKPATGMFMNKGTISHECDPDNSGPVLKTVMGAETVTANAANPTASAVTTTLSAALAIGFQLAIPAAMTNIVVGQSLTIDTSTQAETVVVKQVTTTGFYAYFTKTHASAATITNAAVVLAYDHLYTLGSPREFFTAQLNRVLDAVSYTGCKASKLSISVNEKSIVELKLSVEGQSEVVIVSPTTPAYSTLFPFIFETAGNFVKVNGVNSDATVQSWTIDIDTGLITDFPAFGQGRLRAQMPETVTKVSGTLNLAFETQTMMQAFWGISGATFPQNTVIPTALDFKFFSSEYVNTAVPYALEIIANTSMLTGDDVDLKPADYLKQAVKFNCYESINGAQDDVKMILTNAGSGSF